MDDGVALVGRAWFSEVIDLTADLSVLDSSGTWVLVIPFAGKPVCARFASVHRTAPVPAHAWCGPPRDSWESSLDRPSFGLAVAAIRDSIAAGDVYQVNLCRVLSAPVTGEVDPVALGAVLAQGNPAPHAAIVHLPQVGLSLASASPELFLRRRGDVVESAPIKGTAVRADQLSAKDRAENVMIVDLVRNDLGRVCEYGSVAVPELCSEEPHPGLCHLVSRITGRLRRDVGWPELIAATFPPGSVTGAPKLAALQIIDRLEPAERGPYCGAIGWVDADRSVGELNVAIRTFWSDGGHLRFGTGGAVTWGSTETGEWEETELKARHLLRLASH